MSYRWIAVALLLSGCAGGPATVPVEERSGVAEMPRVVEPVAPEPPPAATAYPAPSTTVAPSELPATPAYTPVEPVPAEPPTGYTPAPSREPTGALLALLEQADDQQQRGNTTQALSLLERAQRIAPREPLVYLQLARLRLEIGDRQRGEQLARKGLSLTDDPQMRRAFRTLLGQ